MLPKYSWMLGLLLLSIIDYTFKGNWYFVSQWLTIAYCSLLGLGSQPNLHRCAGTGFGLTCTGLVHVVIIVTSSYVHLLCCVQKTGISCQANHFCSSQCSEVGMIGGYFSPPASCLAAASTIKLARGMKFPRQDQLAFSGFYDSSM